MRLFRVYGVTRLVETAPSLLPWRLRLPIALRAWRTTFRFRRDPTKYSSGTARLLWPVVRSRLLPRSSRCIRTTGYTIGRRRYLWCVACLRWGRRNLHVSICGTHLRLGARRAATVISATVISNAADIVSVADGAIVVEVVEVDSFYADVIAAATIQTRALPRRIILIRRIISDIGIEVVMVVGCTRSAQNSSQTAGRGQQFRPPAQPLTAPPAPSARR